MAKNTLTDGLDENEEDEWEQDKLTVKNGPTREDGNLTFEGI